MLKKAIQFSILLLISFSFISGCSGASQSSAHTPTFTPRPTPWGPPASITARLASTLPCKLSGDRCREWQFTVTFTSDNNIGGKLENMRMAFVSRENEVYAKGGFPTWFGVNIIIPANGSAQYQGKVVNPKTPDLAGGRMDFFYQGYDDNGNKFSGKISVTLTRP
jgi:hypothetical protein